MSKAGLLCVVGTPITVIAVWWALTACLIKKRNRLEGRRLEAERLVWGCCF